MPGASEQCLGWLAFGIRAPVIGEQSRHASNHRHDDSRVVIWELDAKKERASVTDLWFSSWQNSEATLAFTKREILMGGLDNEEQRGKVGLTYFKNLSLFLVISHLRHKAFISCLPSAISCFPSSSSSFFCSSSTCCTTHTVRQRCYVSRWNFHPVRLSHRAVRRSPFVWRRRALKQDPAADEWKGQTRRMRLNCCKM